MSMHTPLSVPVGPVAQEPPMSEDLFAAVVMAFRWAWALLRAETTVDPMTDEEERISFELSRLMNQRVNGKRRAPMLHLFETVQREAQHAGATGTFRNRPDLTLRPKSLPNDVTNQDDWGIFAECKIIEGKRHHARKYCQQGLQKFIDGRYASRMTTGLMVAFARDGRRPRSTLQSFFRAETFAAVHLRACGRVRDMARSAHNRSQLAPPCVDIDVTHLWLDARPHGSRGRPLAKP